MYNLYLGGLLAFPSTISLAENQWDDTLVSASVQLPTAVSSVNEYFDFNQHVSKKLQIIFPAHYILEGSTKQPASKRKCDDLIFIVFFFSF